MKKKNKSFTLPIPFSNENLNICPCKKIIPSENFISFETQKCIFFINISVKTDIKNIVNCPRFCGEKNLDDDKKVNNIIDYYPIISGVA